MSSPQSLQRTSPSSRPTVAKCFLNWLCPEINALAIKRLALISLTKDLANELQLKNHISSQFNFKKLNKYAPNEKLYLSIVHYQDLVKLLSDTINFNDFQIAKFLLLPKYSPLWGEVIILN